MTEPDSKLPVGAAFDASPTEPRPGADIRLTIATRLKEAREHAGLIQGQVATMTGLDQAKISRIEMGGFMTPPNIKRLAELYDVSIDWLYGMLDETPLPPALLKQIAMLPPQDRVKLASLVRSMA